MDDSVHERLSYHRRRAVMNEPVLNRWGQETGLERAPAFNEVNLYDDDRWIDAAKKVHQMFEGEPFRGTRRQAYDYGINKMVEFNFNLVETLEAGVRFHDRGEDELRSFIYLDEQYNRLPMFTAHGVGRAVGEMAQDPVNYVPATGGFLGAQALKFVGKKALLARIKQQLGSKVGRISTAHGMGYGAADAGARVEATGGDAGSVEGGVQIAAQALIQGAVEGGMAKVIQGFVRGAKQGGGDGRSDQ